MSFSELIQNPITWVVAALAVGGIIFKFGMWVGAVNADRKSFGDIIKEIRGDIKEILGRLPAHTLSSGSPLTLTKLGERVAECLHSSEIVEDLFENYKEKFHGLSAYDVQKMCFKIVSEWKPPENIEDRIKDCAYRHGIDRKITVEVIAIQLRDRILASRD